MPLVLTRQPGQKIRLRVGAETATVQVLRAGASKASILFKGMHGEILFEFTSPYGQRVRACVGGVYVWVWVTELGKQIRIAFESEQPGSNVEILRAELIKNEETKNGDHDDDFPDEEPEISASG